MRTQVSRVELEDCEPFRGFPRDTLERIKELAAERTYGPNEVVFREGDPAVEVYILASGQIELTYTLPTNDSVALPITKVQPGEVFAWSAVVEGESLSAKAQTITESQVYAIPAAQLHDVLRRDPSSGYEFMCRIAQLARTRLRDTRHQLRWLQSYYS